MSNSAAQVRYVEGVAVVTYSAGATVRAHARFRVLATLEHLDPNDPELTRKSDRIARQKAIDEAPPRVAVISAQPLTLHGAIEVALEALERPLNPEARPITTWVEEVPAA